MPSPHPLAVTKVGDILALLGSGPKTNFQIAQALDTDSTDVSRTMARLVHRGLVERDIAIRHQIGGRVATYRLKGRR